MSGQTIIWILVAIIVLIAIGALVFALASRNKSHQAEQAREEASELRAQAAAHKSTLQESDLQAREAQVEADRARQAAEAAEAQAAEARTAHDYEQARMEDQVREADRIDPDVDHTANDYRPATDLDGDGRPDTPTDASATGEARTVGTETDGSRTEQAHETDQTSSADGDGQPDTSDSRRA